MKLAAGYKPALPITFQSPLHIYLTSDLQLIAHRGASADAPENTLPAFDLAWRQGADGIEGDFHLTKDGQIVCIHDEHTGNVADQRMRVADSTLEQLRTLDFAPRRDPAGIRIPTLEEVLATVPAGKRMFIELKSGDPAILPPLLAQLRHSPLRSDQVTCISFHAGLLRELKERAPEIAVNWLVSFSLKSGRRPRRDWPTLIDTLRDLRADGLGTSPHRDITADHLAQLEDSGFQHHVWTVNDPATARRFLAMGTRSITTDVPGFLREQLALL